MNISRIGYTRLDIDLLFCHICMTAVHKAKWLASMKARLSLAQPSLPNFYLHKKEVTAAFKQYKASFIAYVTSKQTTLSVYFPTDE